jgi:hypothetical protein
MNCRKQTAVIFIVNSIITGTSITFSTALSAIMPTHDAMQMM